MVMFSKHPRKVCNHIVLLLDLFAGRATASESHVRTVDRDGCSQLVRVVAIRLEVDVVVANVATNV